MSRANWIMPHPAEGSFPERLNVSVELTAEGARELVEDIGRIYPGALVAAVRALNLVPPAPVYRGDVDLAALPDGTVVTAAMKAAEPFLTDVPEGAVLLGLHGGTRYWTLPEKEEPACGSYGCDGCREGVAAGLVAEEHTQGCAACTPRLREKARRDGLKEVETDAIS